MKGRKPEITAALDKPPPAPAWLPRYAKAEWARVVPALVKARTLIVLVSVPANAVASRSSQLVQAPEAAKRKPPEGCGAWRLQPLRPIVEHKKRAAQAALFFAFLWASMPQTIVAEIRPGRRVVGLVTLGARGRISAA
jgi:hypothetical protein